jgi:hypothetical protein
MERERVANERTLTMMQNSHERALALSDPTTLIALFQQGLNVGKDLNNDNTDPISVIANTSLEGLKQVRGIMSLKASMKRPTLPGGGNRKPPAGKRNPATPASLPPASGPLPSPDKLLAFQALCAQKGLTIPEVLDNLTSQIANMPDYDPNDPEEDEEDPENEPSAGTGEGESTGAA